MKFGETFTEYLHGDQERFLDKCSHVPYKRLKKVLKSCRICRASASSSAAQDVDEEKSGGELSHCRCESCPLCDQMFFSELTKEASAIAGCFSSRVRHLLHLHVSTGLLRYMWRLAGALFCNWQKFQDQDAGETHRTFAVTLAYRTGRILSKLLSVR